MRLLLALSLTLMPTLVAAETYEVRMMNRTRSGSMVFDPPYLNIMQGDTVRFIATSRGHNAASIDGMLPAGAPSFKGQINEEITLKLDMEGLYGVKCTPHFAMGMAMLIEVGKPVASAKDLPDNLPLRAAERLRGHRKDR